MPRRCSSSLNDAERDTEQDLKEKKRKRRKEEGKKKKKKKKISLSLAPNLHHILFSFHSLSKPAKIGKRKR
jgi:hypothetical protein